MKREKGFTLIELMIVVAIIGILAAIAIPRFAALIDKAREAGARGNLGAIRSAIAIYYGDTKGYWPPQLAEGTAAITSYAFAGTGTEVPIYGEPIPGFVPRYLSRIPFATLKRSVPNSRSNEVAYARTSPEAEIATSTIATVAVGSHTAGAAGGWAYSPFSGDCRIDHSGKDTTVLTDPSSTMMYCNYGHEEP